jgi:hypothetical protein
MIIILLLQHKTADSAPFLMNDNNDCSKLSSRLPSVLAKIPSSLKADGAAYPVLRVFASYPGEAKLERTLDWKEETRKSKQANSCQQEANELDPDLHPLATLHFQNFENVAKKFNGDCFRGVAEQRIVKLAKRENEGVEAQVYNLRRKRKRLPDASND